MIQNLFYFLSCTLIFSACSTSKETKDNDYFAPNEVKIGDKVCINHSLLVLDSITYAAVVNSKFISHFAFSYEKRLTGYQGFYLIGKTNYIELFHPKSMDAGELTKGEVYVCFASLKANLLRNLNTDKSNLIEYYSDENYNYYSLLINDSTDPIIETFEMKQEHYENWTKKDFNDTLDFLPVDYNSPKESDSSSNYLMNDVIGIGLSLNPNDSLEVTSYLKEIGYDSYSEFNGYTRLSNNDQFIELRISNDNNSSSINRYYIQLNKFVEQGTEVIGNSRIECNGKSAIWIFE